MAWMNSERKAKLAPAIKAACKKYGVKATLSVYHHSTLCLNVSESKIDFLEGHDAAQQSQHVSVNVYHIDRHFTGKALAFLSEVHAAMMDGNHNNSDLQSDYFDVGWYTEINIGKWDKPYKLIK